MRALKDYLNDKEIEIVAKSLKATIQNIREYDSFCIEQTYEDVLITLYDDGTQECSEKEFLDNMDNVFKFECGYLIVW